MMDPICIPTVDLSQERERQAVIAIGTPETYQGHPTTLLHPDGQTLTCVWTLGHGGPCGPMARSTDGGQSWSGPLPVPVNWTSVRNCPAIYRLADPAGTERLFVFAGQGPDGAMHQAHSEDDGRTWTPMRSNDLTCVMPFCTIIPIDGGTRLLGMSNIRRPGETVEVFSNVVAQSLSGDGGFTWNPWRVVLDIPGCKPCEPCLVRSPDGGQLLCLARENNRSHPSWRMLSEDEGRTWSAPVPLPAALTGDRHVARYLPDGRLVIAFRDMAATSPTRGHFIAWVGTYDDIPAGREGQYRVKLLHNYAGTDCGYPGLEVLPDGTVVATTYLKYHPGPEQHSVVSTRFTLAETDLVIGEEETACLVPVPPNSSRSPFGGLRPGSSAAASAPRHRSAEASPHLTEARKVREGAGSVAGSAACRVLGEPDGSAPAITALLSGDYGTPRLLVPAPVEERYAHLSWPKVARAVDGTLVLAYIAGRFHGVHGEGCPAVSRSTDDGWSFTPPAILKQSDRTTSCTAAGNVALGIAGDGALVLLSMAFRGEEANTVDGWRSTDSGVTWAPTDTATLSENRTGSVFGEVFPVPGKGLAVCGHYRAGSRPHTEGIWIAYSQDSGTTWGSPRRILPGALFEPAIRFAGGRFVGLVRAKAEGANRYKQVVSDDLGETWQVQDAELPPMGRPVTLPSPCLVADRAAPSRLYALRTERAAGSSIPGGISLWSTDAATLKWRHAGTVVSFPVELGKQSDFGYPWMAQVDDHTWFLAFYCGLLHGANAIYGMAIRP